MLTILVVAHMGSGNDHIRVVLAFQLSDNFLRFFFRIFEFNCADIFRVTDFRCIFSRQADNSDLNALFIKDF